MFMTCVTTGWWFGTFFDMFFTCFHVLGIVIPSDSWFSEGWRNSHSNPWQTVSRKGSCFVSCSLNACYQFTGPELRGVATYCVICWWFTRSLPILLFFHVWTSPFLSISAHSMTKMDVQQHIFSCTGWYPQFTTSDVTIFSGIKKTGQPRPIAQPGMTFFSVALIGAATAPPSIGCTLKYINMGVSIVMGVPP